MTNQHPIRNWSQMYWFLDNSYEVPIVSEGLVYPTVTHAFTAAQADSLNLKIEISGSPLSAIESFLERIGNPPYDFRGPDTMRRLLEYKFGVTNILTKMTSHQITMATQLIITGRSPLVYGNMVCNNFWGDCACSKHLQVAGKNVLGGLIMGVREKLIDYVTKGVAKDQLCRCEKPNEDFYLWAHEGKLWLRPICSECQAPAAMSLCKLSDDHKVYRFEKEWFRDETKKSEAKKKSVINAQIFRHGIGSHLNESGLEDTEYVRRWEEEVYGHNIQQMNIHFKKEEEKPLARNVTYYLSGRIS